MKSKLALTTMSLLMLGQLSHAANQIESSNLVMCSLKSANSKLDISISGADMNSEDNEAKMFMLGDVGEDYDARTIKATNSCDSDLECQVSEMGTIKFNYNGEVYSLTMNPIASSSVGAPMIEDSTNLSRDERAKLPKDWSSYDGFYTASKEGTQTSIRTVVVTPRLTAAKSNVKQNMSGVCVFKDIVSGDSLKTYGLPLTGTAKK